MNKKIAFTMVEAMIILVIGAFISTITAVSVKNTKEHFNILALRKSVLDLNSALNNVLSNKMYYSDTKGFADLSHDNFDNIVISNAKTKFQMVMFDDLEIAIASPVKCTVMQGDYKITENADCYLRDDGTVWYIPNTDFDSVNMLKASNASGATSLYVPVTIYPNSKFILSKDEFEKNAVVIGVRRDGATIHLNSVDCSKDEFKKYNQCKIVEHLTKKSFSR